MAVVEMQKVRAIVHQPDVDGFLDVLQRHGAMEFASIEDDSTAELTELSGVAPHASVLPRVQHAISKLN